jgi:hypothetical protein
MGMQPETILSSNGKSLKKVFFNRAAVAIGAVMSVASVSSGFAQDQMASGQDNVSLSGSWLSNIEMYDMLTMAMMAGLAIFILLAFCGAGFANAAYAPL